VVGGGQGKEGKKQSLKRGGAGGFQVRGKRKGGVLWGGAKGLTCGLERKDASKKKHDRRESRGRGAGLSAPRVERCTATVKEGGVRAD